MGPFRRERVAPEGAEHALPKRRLRYVSAKHHALGPARWLSRRPVAGVATLTAWMDADGGLRVLVPGDEARLFEFLERHVDTSLFFFSNVERAGLVDRGEPLQGTYVASFAASGAITAAACHAWNGNVMLQGDAGLEAAVVEAVAVSGRPVQGLIGTWALVSRARRALGLAEKRARHDGREVLFSLPLERLREPQVLAREDVALRVPTLAEAIGLLSEWRVAYEVETLGSKRDAAVERAARAAMEGWLGRGLVWVLTCEAEIVSMTGFNAVARGVVQVGGVYTPPALRARGYGRAAVAASLKQARDQGATRSVLFTAEKNLAAQRAYTALGYQVAGDFGLVLF